MAERVSLIATVFNEAASIDAWMASVRAQTRTADEIVIVDAGSTDGTLERLRAFAAEAAWVRVVVRERCSVPQGRNAAIAAAAGPLVAVTDAGTVLEPDWLEQLLAPLEDRPEVAVSAGFFRPDGATAFARVLATVITPRLSETDPERFLPSSRSVAFRRSWWERVGGYPEWLRAGEDLVFDLRLKAAGARFAFAPGAVVRWRPRPSLTAFFRQYRHYARGDGHGHLWTRRHAVRYAAYGTGAALVVHGAHARWPWPVLVSGGVAYQRKFWRRLREEQPVAGRGSMVAAYAAAPVIVAVGDVAKMLGYPQGLWERFRAGGPEGLERTAITSHRA